MYMMKILFDISLNLKIRQRNKISLNFIELVKKIVIVVICEVITEL